MLLEWSREQNMAHRAFFVGLNICRCLYFESIIPTMFPKPFDYFSPKTLGEALELYGGNAEVKILAGGQSLIPALKL